MWIDSNTYIGHWPFRQLKNNTCKDILKRMDRYQVEASVVSNLNGIFYKDTQPANQELYEQIRSNKRYQDRLVPFAVINPIYSGWKDDLKKSVSKLGMKGVRLYPKYHGYTLKNPSCVELVKKVRDLGLPVALSLRMVDSRPSSWLDINQEWTLKDVVPIIEAVPDAKFMILNIANNTLLEPDQLDLFKKSNLFMDTSGRNITNLGKLIETFGKEKFGFGTHAPILDYRTGALRIESLSEDEADEKTKQQLRYYNIKRLLQL
jgi:uncharacterized protein